jgi:UDP-2,3-diacylglucosamine pyrophosphatase LpxH
MHYRAVFLSDFHLASKKCRTKELNKFLKENEFDNLYLVGDIVDIWRFKQVFHMNREKQNEHLEVIERILKMARKGTTVHYIYGNHDEFMGKFIGGSIFGNISLHERIEHTTSSGKKYLIMHGHQFDLLTKYPVSSTIYKIGDYGYEFLLGVNEWYNLARRMLGLRYWSISKYVKIKVKRATQFIESFEEVVSHYARERKYDGIICGHLHDPKMKSKNGFVYANTGCWTEKDNCTFLYEDNHGNLKLKSYSSVNH